MDMISYRPLLWLLLLGPLLWVFAGSLVERSRILKVASFVLRCLGIGLLVLGLCRPFLGLKVDETHVVFLVDVSESVDLESSRSAVGTIRDYAGKLRSGDSWSLFSFGAELKQTDADSLEAELTDWIEKLGDDAFRRESRIANALLTARMSFPAGKSKRIVLFTDGRETGGELDEALDILDEEKVDLLVEELTGVSYPEASIISLEPNTRQAYYQETIRLTVRLSSNRDMEGKLRFFSRGVLEEEVPVKLSEGQETVVAADVALTTTGSTVWAAELVPEEDHFPLNNRASCTVDVKGRAKVLVLHEKPSLMRPLARSLREQGMDLDVRGKRGLPEAMEEILEFDAIVIANLAATDMSTRQMINLKSYVCDFGGGLAMLGSENSFGLGGYYQTPVEEVLPIVSRYEKEKEKPSLAMVLVIDKSGSMSGVPIALARQAGKASVELLSYRDKIGVVAFDGEPYIVCEMTSASDADAICASIDRIAAGGGTNMYPAMARGKELLETAHTKIRHMIILSDGQSMPGPFHDLAGEMANDNMTVSAVALGGGADRGLMKSIADIGRGRYYETMDASTVPRIFTKETVEASRSAIKEEPFEAVQVGDADLLEGIDFQTAPFLLGYVMTRAKPTAKMQLITEGGDPLLAIGRYGLGTTVAFTSNASGNWASEWHQWKSFGKFWAQILRCCLRKTDSSGLAIKREEDYRKVHFLIQSKDAAGEPQSGLDWDGMVLHEAGGRDLIEVRETGLGMYEVELDRPTVGRFTVRLYDKDNGRLKVLHYHEDYPREYRLAGRGEESLARARRLADSSFEGKLAAVQANRSIQNPALIAAMVLLISSVLLRRI